jgi:hypothetical protein
MDFHLGYRKRLFCDEFLESAQAVISFQAEELSLGALPQLLNHYGGSLIAKYALDVSPKLTASKQSTHLSLPRGIPDALLE